MGKGRQLAAGSCRSAVSSRVGVPIVVAAISLLATTACSFSPGAPAPTATAVATQGTLTPATPPAMPVSPEPATPAVFSSTRAVLGAVVWTATLDAETKAPVVPVGQFTAEVEAIYAAIPVLRLETGVTIRATWTYNDTPVDELTGQVTAGERYVDSWLEFHITRSPDELWPSGTYQITILVDDEEAVTAEVEVLDGEDA